MKTYCRFFLSISLFFSISLSFAQNDKHLPKWLAKEEQTIIKDFQFRESGVVNAPSTLVRTSAEWEEVEYLVLSWEDGFKSILKQIVEAAVKECKVIIAAGNNASGVESYLQSKGVDLSKVTILKERTNTIWIRDFAANTIYSNDVGERALVDWIYNRPRPKDDVLPYAHAKALNIPLYKTTSGKDDLVNTGGNFMSDGLGNAFASELILEENRAGNSYNVSAKSESQIDNIMQRYMGINRYVKMETLPYDGIHHIDMHMKLLNEETLLVSKYPDGIADGPQIEENIGYILNNFKSPFGTPYIIKRIDSPKDKNGRYPDSNGSYCTFSNSVIINKTILVPVYRKEVNEKALNTYRELMPGYKVIGIDVDNNGENLIAQSGAIHCITHTIGVENPLLIVHQPIKASNSSKTIEIKSMIKHNSGIKNAKVLWRKKGDASFKATEMILSNKDNWSAVLPSEASTYDVEYYIEATANSGKTLTRPLVAPKGYWTITNNTLSVYNWAQESISKPFPNPTKDKVSFNLENILGDVTISIYNSLGQKVYAKKIVSKGGVVTLNLKDNWIGLLNVVFKGEFGEVNRRIIKM